MTIKELREELEKYPDDTECYLWAKRDEIETMLNESADVGAFVLEVLEWKSKEGVLDTGEFFLSPKECIMS